MAKGAARKKPHYSAATLAKKRAAGKRLAARFGFKKGHGRKKG